ncbi:PhzF family phenazine biosynthesis protein [Loigolactobacillus binensis]|uniref:PhzF family phenazine biosynthesis protein n=1 Tax=Loigolactobacillus binensis TaxID=2559922 RepID=A0ABW3EBR9_9LACO|nr:PhzF family phenazine biosynthesis protein [Loigolactobacillus binensis]
MKNYLVDAFTKEIFKGNPAAVCIVNAFPTEQLMQNIAQENRLSETAFVVKNNAQYELRWFTPGGEIDLCGHATLAAAYVLLHFYVPTAQKIEFNTKSGQLTVSKAGGLLTMDFPAYSLKKVAVTAAMTQALGVTPQAAYYGRDLVCVLANEQQVKQLTPDFAQLEQLPGLLQHVTAVGNGEFDCVSRSFGPKLAVPEDPVCGSGHCHIVPLWAQKLHKTKLTALQASPRTGILYCENQGSRVKLSGYAVLYALSELQL